MALRSFGAEAVGDPFVKLAADVVASGQFGRYYDLDGNFQQGQVAALEARFGTWTGRQYAVAQASGSQALLLALAAFGVSGGKGGEVIVPAYSFVACPMAVLWAGATPVLAGVGHELTLTASEVTRLITDRTMAVMNVPMRGRPGGTAAVAEAAHHAGVPLIEDLSQFEGLDAGTGSPDSGHADAAVFSFQSRKMLTAGEGGMVVLDDEPKFRAIVQAGDPAWFLRPQSASWPPPATLPPPGSRMNEVTAALVLSQWDEVSRTAERGRAVRKALVVAIGAAGGDVLAPQDDRTGLAVAVGVRPGSDATELVSALVAAGVGVFPESAGVAEPHSYPGWPSYIAEQCRIDTPAAASLELLHRVAVFQVQPDWAAADLDRVATLVGRFS